MLTINQQHLIKFKQIRDQFCSRTKIPKENNWRSWSDNDVWLHTMEQVIVVGSSAPLSRFHKSNTLRSEVAYERLTKMTDEQKVSQTINNVLTAIGTRYARSDASKCAKTKALVKNLQTLKTYGGGKRFMQKLFAFQGPNAEKQRIGFVIDNFFFIKNKGARDYLMELGLVMNAIALDVRVQNVLKKVGIQVPEGLQGDAKLYGEVQNDVLEKICKPLGISGIQFDRMLYQNYEEIMRMPL